MNGLERLVEWAATLMVASLTWVSGIAVPVVPTDQAPTFLAWAQDDAQPPIEAVEEGDVETLDEGAPPVAEPQPVSDTAAQEDVPLDPTGQPDPELLDQGSPPTTQLVPVETFATDVATAPAPVAAAAPAPLYAAEPVASGYWLPPGFGTGQVLVSAGNAEFPEGLANCHVGAVTGRAYVGIECGGDNSFVGHAPSFTDFPFVVEAPFPFDSNDSALFDAQFPFDSNDQVVFETTAVPVEETNDVFVSATGSRTARQAEEAANPTVESAGSGSVSLFQSGRDREPRIRVNDGDSGRSNADNNNGNNNRVRSQGSDGSATALQSESKKQKAKDGKKKQKARDGRDKDRDKDNEKGKDKKKDRKHGKNDGKKRDRDKKDGKGSR